MKMSDKEGVDREPVAVSEDKVSSPFSGVSGLFSRFNFSLDGAQTGLQDLKGKVGQRAADLKEVLEDDGSREIDGVPSELKYRKKVELAAEHMIISTGVGFLVGGVVSLLVFRGKGPRYLLTGFSAGCGAGSSYMCSKDKFGKK
mmetsp:Transcript_7541/g.16439  ORF Transcript_7541/g.16439 Transcript_7541/m.16439 type:complete len:144 (-) Transcript_7541:40-471(-)